MAFRDDPIGFGLQQLSQGLQKGMLDPMVALKLMNQQQKIQQEQRENEAFIQTAQEAGWPAERIKRYIASSPTERKNLLKAHQEPSRGALGNLFFGTPKNVLAPQTGLLSTENINEAVQQLRQAGVEDEQIAQLLQEEQQIQQEEQGPFSPLRALGGAATAAAGAGGARALQTLAPAIGTPLLARSLGDLGISALNEIANAFGQGRPFPSISEKIEAFDKIGERAVEDAMKMGADIVEKKTGKRPDITAPKLEAPLKSLEKYASIGGITQGLRDIAKNFGLNIEPRTYAEKKVAQTAGGLAFLFDPKRATKEGIANALKVAGIQAGGAEGAGLLGKVITGSDLVDKGMTFAGYMLAQRYPGAIDKYRDDQYSRWDNAIKNKNKATISANSINKKLASIEKDLAKGDPNTPAKKFVRENIVDSIKNAQKDTQYQFKNGKPVALKGKLSPQDLDDLYKSLNKKELYKNAQKHQVMPEWKKAKEAISDAITKWGNKNAPEALEGFRTANDIFSTQANASSVGNAIRTAAGGGFLSLNPARLLLKLFGKPGAVLADEIAALTTSPGVRRAYYNILKAGAKNNPEAIGDAGEKLAAAIKKKNLSLYEKLIQKTAAK